MVSCSLLLISVYSSHMIAFVFASNSGHLLFLTPLLLLNYILFNLFLFLQKKGGAKVPLAPPSARSLPQENRTLSSSHNDASHVTQMKIGIWPGTGFERPMVSTFPFRYSVWEFWTTFQDVPFILEKFRLGKPKQSYHWHPNRIFRDFSLMVNKQCFIKAVPTTSKFTRNILLSVVCELPSLCL